MSSQSNFNSIKVQLEPVRLAIVKIIFPFQFHKGTIRTKDLQTSVRVATPFQFHKGTIRTIFQINDKLFAIDISIP